MTTKKNIDRVQKLQNSALRIMFGFPRRQHVTPFREKYQLSSVRQFIFRFSCNFIHKNLKFEDDYSPFQNCFYYSNFSQGRNNHKLFLPACRTQIRQRTVFFRGRQWYNSLPSDIRDQTIENFKNILKKYNLTVADSDIAI